MDLDRSVFIVLTRHCGIKYPSVWMFSGKKVSDGRKGFMGIIYVHKTVQETCLVILPVHCCIFYLKGGNLLGISTSIPYHGTRSFLSLWQYLEVTGSGANNSFWPMGTRSSFVAAMPGQEPSRFWGTGLLASRILTTTAACSQQQV